MAGPLDRVQGTEGGCHILIQAGWLHRLCCMGGSQGSCFCCNDCGCLLALSATALHSNLLEYLLERQVWLRARGGLGAARVHQRDNLGGRQQLRQAGLRRG